MKLDNLRLGEAFGILTKTLPVLLVRLGLMLAFWAVAIIYLLIVGGVAALIGGVIDWLGGLIFLLGIIGVAPLYNFAYRYVFYMIKAAHIAIMAELVAKGSIPDGGQLDYGRRMVTQRFGETNVMFAIDQIVAGVVRAFTHTVWNLVRWLPGDQRAFLQVIQRFADYSLSYIDETIMARSYWNKDVDVWQNARDGVVLYAQSWKAMFSSAFILMLISFVPSIAGLILFAAPVGFLISLFSQQLAGITLIILLMLAWVLKVALGDAFVMAALINTYYHETKDLTPDPEMAARLDSVSDKFGDLARQAQDAVMGRAKRTSAGMPFNDAGVIDPTPTTE